MGSWLSGRRADTPSSDECLRLSLSALRQAGAIRRGKSVTATKEWTRGGVPVGSLTFIVDLMEPTPGIHVTGWAFGRRIEQRLELVSQPQPFGGERWLAKCPRSGRLCRELVMPPGRDAFASMPGWGVRQSVERERSLDRALRARAKANCRIGGLSKFVRKPTRLRLEKKLAKAQHAIDVEEIRVVSR